MSLFQIASGAARGALGRSYMIEKRPNGIPKVVIVFDVVQSEVPEFQADVTDVPVEEGPEVSDHIQLRNPMLKLQGIISQTPIDIEGQVLNLLSGGIEALTSPASRSNFLNAGATTLGGIAGASLLGNSSQSVVGGLTDAIARSSLLSAYERRARFSVVTKRQQFDNMVIQKMSFPRDQSTGDALAFQLEFKEIKIARPFTINIENVGDSVDATATSEVKLGSQATSAVSDSTNEKINGSTLFKLFGG